MTFYDKFPYTNFQEINLDYILERLEDIEKFPKEYAEQAEAAADTATTAATAAGESAVSAESSAAQAEEAADNASSTYSLTREYITAHLQGAVDTWLDEHFTVTEGVILDNTLMSDSAAADAWVTGALFDLAGMHYYMKKAWYYDQNIGAFDSNAIRLCIYGRNKTNVRLIAPTGFQFVLYELNSDNTCKNPTGGTWGKSVIIPAGLFALNVRKEDNSALSDADVLAFTQNVITDNYGSDMSAREKFGYPVVPVSGYPYDLSLNYCATGALHRRSYGHKGMTTGHTIALQAKSGYQISANYFDNNDMSGYRSSSGWKTVNVIPKHLYTYGIIKNTANTDFNGYDDFFEILNTSYKVTGSERTDIALNDVLLLNKDIQAMEYYNGYFYALTQAALLQYAGDGTLVNTIPMNCGHANALCKGPSGYLYASGWSDRTIYKINLSDFTTQAITLNITGWFSAVYLGGTLYVINAAVYPDTDVTWKIYSVNESTGACTEIATIPEQFTALQDVTAYNGKIIAACGSGTDVHPSKIRVFNLDGTIESSYDLITDRAAEYEGITTSEYKFLFFTDVNGLVYQTTL